MAGSAVLVGTLLLVGCGDDDASDAGTPDASADANTPDANRRDTGMDSAMPGECIPPEPNQPPDLLSCTGLYSDIAAKTLATGVREFAPAVPLWSDGTVKKRWIYLPPGTKIDISDPDSWRFPLGTKFFKEFVWEGKRVETRLFWKVGDENPLSDWVRTAYKWNDAETEATRSGGEMVVVAGHNYEIPTTTQCDQCHKGRVDRALGFETVLLGLPGATGVTLSTLRSEDLVMGGTLPTNVSIGDDGTGHGADALGWLHVNCGVSCHNGNPASEAYKTDLRMLIRTAEADGRAPTGFDTFTTTLDVPVVTGRWMSGMWAGDPRIAPGSAADSVLYSLVSTRDPVDMRDQMPPIGTVIVPPEAMLIRDWINAMGAESGDGGTDSGTDASANLDAGL